MLKRLSLMQRLMAASFVFALLAAACGDDDGGDGAGVTGDEPAPAEEPAQEPAQEPAEEPAEEPAQEPAEEPAEEPAQEEPSGTLRVGFSFATTGEQHFDSRLSGGRYMRLLYAPLMTIDSGGNYVPYLAESVEISEPTRVVVTLRSDAVFENGSPGYGERCQGVDRDDEG